jgi:proteasome lid subunit RPN8/RPN11
MEESDMSQNCSAVVFSNRAYNAIIRETFEKHPVETGGILLGHIVDDTWVVMEVLPPGIHSIFQTAYFEYDEQFVNYLAQSVANQYKRPLSLLGLWHRHPGHMDVFSGTDDQTNSTFARQLPKGVISGLVNVDPKFRFTMYYLDRAKITPNARPGYEKIDVEVGDDIIPPSFFELKYVASDYENLHPLPPSNIQQMNRPVAQQTFRQEPQIGADSEEENNENIKTWRLVAELLKRLFRWIRRHWKETLIVVLGIALALSFGSTIKSCAHNAKEKVDSVMADKDSKGIPTLPAQEISSESSGQQTESGNSEQEKTEQDGKQGDNNN